MKKLFHEAGFNNIIFAQVDPSKLKDILSDYVEPGTRILFALAYKEGNYNHIVKYKVWKTTNGELKTSKIDFEFPSDSGMRHQNDFYPKEKTFLFYDINIFNAISDPSKFFDKNSQINQWFSVNGLLETLGKILVANGNLFHILLFY